MCVILESIIQRIMVYFLRSADTQFVLQDRMLGSFLKQGSTTYYNSSFISSHPLCLDASLARSFPGASLAELSAAFLLLEGCEPGLARLDISSRQISE